MNNYFTFNFHTNLWISRHVVLITHDALKTVKGSIYWAILCKQNRSMSAWSSSNSSVVRRMVIEFDTAVARRLKRALRRTALLIQRDFELWSITCIRLPIATSSVNSNMTKTALLVKSDFELWSVTCIEHELWSLTSFAHGQFNLFTTTFNWIYILSQWLVPFNRSLLVTFLNFNFTFFLLADFDPLFLFVNRLLKYSTTANAVHSEERHVRFSQTLFC